MHLNGVINYLTAASEKPTVLSRVVRFAIRRAYLQIKRSACPKVPSTDKDEINGGILKILRYPHYACIVRTIIIIVRLEAKFFFFSNWLYAFLTAPNAPTTLSMLG